MGASEEQMAMVAGFAGGLGLRGNGCGALAAAIWMNALVWNRTHPGKTTLKNPSSEKLLEAFYEETDYEMQCEKICGTCFKSIDAHTAFVNKGGCKNLVSVLAANYN